MATEQESEEDIANEFIHTSSEDDSQHEKEQEHNAGIEEEEVDIEINADEEIYVKNKEPRLEHIIFLIEYHEKIFNLQIEKESVNTWYILFYSIIGVLKEKAFNNDYVKICIILYDNVNGSNEIYHRVYFLFDLQKVTVDIIKDLMKLQKVKQLKIFEPNTKESDNTDTVTCHFEDILFMINQMIALNCVDSNTVYINKIFHFTSNWKIKIKDENSLLMKLIKKLEFSSEYYFIYLTKEKTKEKVDLDLSKIHFKHVMIKRIQTPVICSFLSKALNTPKTYNSAIIHFMDKLNLQVNVYPLSSKIKHKHQSAKCYCNSDLEIIKPTGSYVTIKEPRPVGKEDLRLRIDIYDRLFLLFKSERDLITHSDTSFIKILQFVDDKFILTKHNILDNYFIYPKRDFYTNRLAVKEEMEKENSKIDDKERELCKEMDEQNSLLFSLLVELLMEKKKIALASYFRKSTPIMVLLIPSLPPVIHKKKDSMYGILMKPYPFEDELLTLDRSFLNKMYEPKIAPPRTEPSEAPSEETKYYDAKSTAEPSETEPSPVNNEEINKIELFLRDMEEPKFTNVNVDVDSVDQDEENMTKLGNIMQLLTVSVKTHKLRDHTRHVLKKHLENEIFQESRSVEPTYVNDIFSKRLYQDSVEDFNRSPIFKREE